MIKLNLLPLAEKENIKLGKVYYLFLINVIFVILSICFLIILLLFIYLFLENQAKNIENSLSSDLEMIQKQKELESLKEKISIINKEIQLIQDIQNNQYYYSILFKDLSENIKDSIKLDNILIEGGSGQPETRLSIKGNALERDQLIDFEKILKSFSYLNNVIEQIHSTKKMDIPFSFNVIILKNQLKNE